MMPLFSATPGAFGDDSLLGGEPLGPLPSGVRGPPARARPSSDYGALGLPIIPSPRSRFLLYLASSCVEQRLHLRSGTARGFRVCLLCLSNIWKQPWAGECVSVGERLVSKGTCRTVQEGGPFDQSNDGTGSMPGAQRDGSSLPSPGGGKDPGHTLLRAVRPGAGGVLRHRRAYGSTEAFGQRAARRAAGSGTAYERGARRDPRRRARRGLRPSPTLSGFAKLGKPGQNFGNGPTHDL